MKTCRLRELPGRLRCDLLSARLADNSFSRFRVPLSALQRPVDADDPNIDEPFYQRQIGTGWLLREPGNRNSAFYSDLPADSKRPAGNAVRSDKAIILPLGKVLSCSRPLLCPNSGTDCSTTHFIAATRSGRSRLIRSSGADSGGSPAGNAALGRFLAFRQRSKTSRQFPFTISIAAFRLATTGGLCRPLVTVNSLIGARSGPVVFSGSKAGKLRLRCRLTGTI